MSDQVQNVQARLDAWRAAERRRDGLAPDSSEWWLADEEVRGLAAAYRAAVAQAHARLVKHESHDRNWGWPVQLDRRTSDRGD